MLRAAGYTAAGHMGVIGKPSAGLTHILIPARTIMGTTVRSITVIRAFIITTAGSLYVGLAPIGMAGTITIRAVIDDLARLVGWFLYSCHPTP